MAEGSGDNGRDLRAGIPVDELKEGEPVKGHHGDQDVIMVQSEGELFAIGATCTHYGGPLAEGLTADGTVRCPWHHACFSLRTGETVDPPALDGVGAWEVEIRDGRAYVGERKRPTVPTPPRAAEVERVVIVGAGAAGTSAAVTLRREGHRGTIHLVDAEPSAPYDRPNLSKDYLAGNAPEEWLPLRPPEFFETERIERVVDEARSVDPEAKRLHLAGGESLDYDALLLATGARPVRLPVPGADLPHAHVLRSLDDCRSIIRDAEGAGKAVVIGASFIGMEVASALRDRDLDVTVVAPEAVPFERTLGDALGEMLRELHEERGVHFRLGERVEAIAHDRVRLGTGATIPADLVVVGIGVRPDTRLAESAGAEVEDGVLVDEFLESSVPGIWVAGDTARWPDPHSPPGEGRRIRIEHWAHAEKLGQTAARNILGLRRPFRRVPFFWTSQHGVSVVMVGDPRGWDEAQIEGVPEKLDAAVRYFRGGRLLALAAVNRPRAALEAEVTLGEAMSG